MVCQHRVRLVTFYPGDREVFTCGEGKQPDVGADVQDGLNWIPDMCQPVAVTEQDLAEFPFVDRSFFVGEGKRDTLPGNPYRRETQRLAVPDAKSHPLS